MGKCVMKDTQLYLSTHNAIAHGTNNEDQTFLISIQDLKGRQNLSLRIYPFYDIQMVKRMLKKQLKLSPTIELRDIRMFYRGAELPNYRMLNAFDKSRKNAFYWCLSSPAMENSIIPEVKELTGWKWSRKMEKIGQEVNLALMRNIKPKLTVDGTGGTYILSSVGRKPIAVFKPIDEEACGIYNPRGYHGDGKTAGLRPGILSGEGASRETAAFLLDAVYGNFANVPITVLAEALHPDFNYKRGMEEISTPSMYHWKSGALQEFVDAKETCGNYSPSMFSLSDVQRIGILDICIMNTDRNDGNLLVTPLQNTSRHGMGGHIEDSIKINEESGSLEPWRSTNGLKISISSIAQSFTEIIQVARRSHPSVMNTSKSQDSQKRIPIPNTASVIQADRNEINADGFISRFRLIPIDHGLTLPDVLDITEFDWVWLEWPQTRFPFGKGELAIIYQMDPDRDAARLGRKLMIRDECLRTMRVSMRLLILGTRMHLTLHDIATMACRQDVDEPSNLEILIKNAMKNAYYVLDSISLVSTNRLGYAADLAAARPRGDTTPISRHKALKVSSSKNPHTSETQINYSSSGESNPTELQSRKTNRHHNSERFGSESKTQTESSSDSDINSEHSLTASSRFIGASCTARRTANRVNHSRFDDPRTDSLWSVKDRYENDLDVDWRDPKFERLFFECFATAVTQFIVDIHPEWHSYPFDGNEFEDAMQAYSPPSD